MTINVMESPPIASGDSIMVYAGQQVSGSLAGDATDPDPIDMAHLTFALVAGPSAGTLSLDSDGSYTYTAPSGASGTDSFTYQVSDGILSSNVALVMIAVMADPMGP